MKKQLLINAVVFLTVTFLLNGEIQAQQQQWVWIKGDSSVNQRGVYGSAGVASANNKPGARGEAMSWKDKSGNFWMFGGMGYGTGNSAGPLNDLWKYNASINQWTWMKGPQLPSGNPVYGVKGVSSASNIPGARQMSETWIDTNGNLWLFGGSGSAYFNDLWKYDAGTNQWTWIHGDNTGNKNGVYGSKTVAAPGNKPGARANAVSWTDQQGNLWLFGGNGYAASGIGGRLNDLWKYNVTANEWTWMNGDSVTQCAAVYGTKNIAAVSNKPGARIGACGWTDESGNLWLFGGIGYTSVYGMLNDLWKYDINNNEWVWMHGDSTIAHAAVYGNNSFIYEPTRPGALHNAVAWAGTNGDVWLFGGRGYTAAAFGELNALWKYSALNNQWTFLKGDPQTYVAGDYGVLEIPAFTNKPGSREKPVAWTDSIGNIWMFGGEYYPLNTTATNYNNDLWKFGLVNLLPVNLVSFSGSLANKTAVLTWKTENEMNVDYYEVERSVDGRNFFTAGKVKGMQQHEYRFTDPHISDADAQLYYRLKITDLDGRYYFSEIIVFDLLAENNPQVYPNPAKDFTIILFPELINSVVHIRIYNENGKLFLDKEYKVAGKECIVPLSDCKTGNYIIIIDHDNKKYKQRLFVSR
ncbi:MAG: T9SS type A sorting domain-containing protein [Bacteroidetes bacterium]|nr:T9SS type A sorting domain-containing protein [Bacteroidota bacterium]